MAPPRRGRPRRAAAGPAGPALAEAAMNLVDVPDVVCPAGAGSTSVRMRLPLTDGADTEDSPAILTFFRTSPKAAAVTFSLLSADGLGVIPSQRLALEDLSSRPSGGASRRLGLWHGGLVDEGRACEDFFLSDGRAPVALPDTWREARQAFLEVCEHEGWELQECRGAEESLFRGYPRGEVPLEGAAGLCRRLARHAAAFMPYSAATRRLKGGTSSTSSGGTPAKSFSSSAHPGLGPYGYSTARAAAVYPAGYATTSYGYAGRSTLVGGTAFVIWPFMGLGGRGHSRADSHQAGQPDAACEPLEGQPCAWQLAPGEDFIRDDLLALGFWPGEYTPPFNLTVESVEGSDYAAARICPPTGWTPSNASWQPPPQQDLFAALTYVEEIIEEEEEEDIVLPPAAWGSLLVVLLLCCGCCVLLWWWRCRRSPHQRAWQEMKGRRAHMLATRGWVVPDQLELQGSYTDSITQSKGCRRYDLRFDTSGGVRGAITIDALLTGSVRDGKLKWEGKGSGAVMWTEAYKDLELELEGRLQTEPNGAFALAATLRGGSGPKLAAPRSGVLAAASAAAGLAPAATVLGAPALAAALAEALAQPKTA